MKKFLIEIFSVLFLLLLIVVAAFFITKRTKDKKAEEEQKEYEIFDAYFKDKLIETDSLKWYETGAKWGVISDFNNDGKKEMLLYEDEAYYRFYVVENDEIKELEDMLFAFNGGSGAYEKTTPYLIDGKWHYLKNYGGVIYYDENRVEYAPSERINNNNYEFYTYEDGVKTEVFKYEISENGDGILKFERTPEVGSASDMSKEEMFVREVEMIGNINGTYFGMNLYNIMSDNYYQLITIDNWNVNKNK